MKRLIILFTFLIAFFFTANVFAGPVISGKSYPKNPTFYNVTLSETLKTHQGADVASATAVTLGVGNYFDITGTVTIATITTIAEGTQITLHFDGILILTHSNDLFLPTAANITTAAGDIAIFYEYSAGDWRCISYARADGSAIAPATGVVLKTDFNANTILRATTDDTPQAMAIAEQTIVGRKTGGNIDDLSATEVRAIISVADGADVTGDNAPKAHAASHTDGTDDIQDASTSQKGLLNDTDWDTFNEKAAAGANTDIYSLEGAAGIAPAMVTSFTGTISAGTRTVTFSATADYTLCKIGSRLKASDDVRIVMALLGSDQVTIDANTTWGAGTTIQELQEPISQNITDGTVVGYINALGGQGFVGGFGAQYGVMFDQDGDSEIYASADDTIMVKAGAGEIGFFSSQGFGCRIADSAKMRNRSSMATITTVIPNRTYETTGIGGEDGHLSQIAGGVEAIRSIEANSIVYNVLNAVQKESVTDASTDGTTTVVKAGTNFTTNCAAGDLAIIWSGTTVADFGVYIVESVADGSIVFDSAPSGSNADVDFYVFNGGTVTTGSSLYTGSIIAMGGIIMHRTAAATDYNPSILTNDYIIAVTSTGADRAVTISTEDVNSGSTDNPRIFIIKDEGGGAAANNITVSLESGNIDGAGTAVISANYASVTIYLDGTNGWIY